MRSRKQAEEELAMADREEKILDIVAEQGRLEQLVRRRPHILQDPEVRASLYRLDELRRHGSEKR
jgi:hypothetical protein